MLFVVNGEYDWQAWDDANIERGLLTANRHHLLLGFEVNANPNILRYECYFHLTLVVGGLCGFDGDFDFRFRHANRVHFFH